MHGRRWGICGLLTAIGFLLVCSGGCSWHRTCQGWIIQSGWSLEFKRNAALCCQTSGCDESCNDANCTEPNGVSTTDGESNVLYEANPKLLEKLNPSPFAKLMERRGRLGICASCGRLGRFQEPPEGAAAAPPVNAKFNPVPTQPVFCPKDVTTQPTGYDAPVPEKKPKSSGTPGASKIKPTKPEEIPLPPPTSKNGKSAAVARKLDGPSESSSWIFSSRPDKKPDPVIEAQLPPRPSEPATRR